jgi:predicted Fe-Mo cluster-binding NifX family protein
MKSRWILRLVLALVLMPVAASGADPFLIAVASDDKEATSLVSDYAARSRYYLLFSGTDFVQVVHNPFMDKGRGAAPDVVDYLAQKGVGLLIAGRFGPFMIEALDKKGMKYFQFSGVAKEAAARAADFLQPPKKDEKMPTQ